MLKRFFWKHTVPVIYLNGDMDQQRTLRMLNKIQKVDYKRAIAIAIVVNISEAMPVQIQKLYELLQRIKFEYNVPIYGFATGKCIPESYYLLSGCNKIYATKSTIFSLTEQFCKLNIKEKYKQHGIKKIQVLSNPHLVGRYYDFFTKPGPRNIFASKQAYISQKLIKYSLQNRNNVIKNLQENPLTLPATMIGAEAMSKQLIDSQNHYYKVIATIYPQCKITEVTYQQENYHIKQIIVALFLFKVFLKYLLITIVYLTAKNKQKKKKEKEQLENTQS